MTVNEVVHFLNSDNITTNDLLEHANVIVVSNNKEKKIMLENIIRWGNIDIKILGEIKNKLSDMSLSLLESNTPINDNIQQDIVNFHKLLENQIISSTENIHSIVSKLRKDLYDTSMPVEITENINYDTLYSNQDNLIATLENILIKSPVVNYENLQCSFRILLDDNINIGDKTPIKKALNKVIENTIRYQINNKEFIDLPVTKLMDSLVESLYTKYDKTIIDNLVNDVYTTEEISELINSHYKVLHENGNLVFNPNPHTLNAITPMSIDSSVMIRTISNNLLDIIETDDYDKLEESLNTFTRLYTVCEKSNIAKGIRKVGNTIEKGAKAARNIKDDVKEIEVSTKKSISPITKSVDNMLEKMKKADENDRREIILKQGLVPKLIRFIKQGILSAGVYAVNPALGAITLITLVGTNKALDARVKNKMLYELETELELTNEKIEDSRGDENKQSKYELIKIRKQLEKSITKIRLNRRVDD